MDLGPGVSLITTLADKVITQPECDTDMVRALMPCNHQEADSRMLLHLKHASENGHQKAMIRIVDTDVVILVISTFIDHSPIRTVDIFRYKKVTSIYLLIFGIGKSGKSVRVYQT